MLQKNNRLYMVYLMLMACEKGYDLDTLAREATHKEWLALCYEIHDRAIIRWRSMPGTEYVPIWTTYGFRQFILGKQ